MRGRHAFAVIASMLLFASHGAADDGRAPQAPDPVAASAAIVDQIQAEATTARQALRMARAQRDVVKTLCLNDKLTQLDVAARSAGQRREALLTAAAQGDTAAVGQERARLDVYREQARRVAAEAQLCIGTPDPGKSETGNVSMTAPPLPNPVDYPAPDDVFAVLQPPASVSPYK